MKDFSDNEHHYKEFNGDPNKQKHYATCKEEELPVRNFYYIRDIPKNLKGEFLVPITFMKWNRINIDYEILTKSYKNLYQWIDENGKKLFERVKVKFIEKGDK